MCLSLPITKQQTTLSMIYELWLLLLEVEGVGEVGIEEPIPEAAVVGAVEGE